jgi:BlaI family transcriptional regulator, penicillinase repressor
METKQLTELQLAIMRVLWQHDEATVVQIQEALQEERKLALTTIATVLSRLEKDGVVQHRTEGRSYVYQSLLTEQEVQRSVVSDLLEHLFAGDPTALVHHLLREAEIDADELDTIKALIEAEKRQREQNDE